MIKNIFRATVSSLVLVSVVSSAFAADLKNPNIRLTPDKQGPAVYDGPALAPISYGDYGLYGVGIAGASLNGFELDDKSFTKFGGYVGGGLGYKLERERWYLSAIEGTGTFNFGGGGDLGTYGHTYGHVVGCSCIGSPVYGNTDISSYGRLGNSFELQGTLVSTPIFERYTFGYKVQIVAIGGYNFGSSFNGGANENIVFTAFKADPINVKVADYNHSTGGYGFVGGGVRVSVNEYAALQATGQANFGGKDIGSTDGFSSQKYRPDFTVKAGVVLTTAKIAKAIGF